MSAKKKIQKYIHIHKARENNLQAVEVDIPLYQLTVVTGLSGSGKSSLVMDVLYAEAQRKFAESMTSYARQFLANSYKPDVDYITGLCPAISVSQRKFSSNSRSTVGTVTEVYDYLRLLFGRIGKIISPITNKEVQCYEPIDIATELIHRFQGKKIFLTFSLLIASKKQQQKEQVSILQRKGFSRFYDNKKRKIVDMEELDSIGIIKGDNMEVLVDRVVLSNDKDNQQRLIDSIQTALFEGDNRIHVFFEDGTMLVYSTLLEEDNLYYIAPNANLFSFNNAYGICPKCEGYGTVLDIDPSLVIPDQNKSVYEEAIAAWRGERMSNYLRYFIDSVEAYNFPIHRPIKQLSEEQLHLLWYGNQEVRGIYDFFDEVKRNLYKIQYRVLLSRYQGRTFCRDCEGYRLRKEALYIKVKDKHIGQLTQLTIEDLRKWLKKQRFSNQEKVIANRLLVEINQRLETLEQVGLGYLTLSRPMATLSGGESQRVQLTKFIGSNLTDSLYILDEPSIGLHHKDTYNLIVVLRHLRDLGNTVVVVEHDESIIRHADYIIDMGPLAGKAGGTVVAQGDIEQILKKETLTAQYLNNSLSVQRNKKSLFKKFIRLVGASLFNVKDARICIPINALTVVHGPSGAGKSSLINSILYPAICKQKKIASDIKLTGTYDSINFPLQSIESVEWISQQSVSRLSRSNPISYVKAYDDIRKLFAKLPESKQLGLMAGTFSFNSPGGRCEECKGDGRKIIEMQFLPPVKLVCEQCNGQRFTEEVLSIKLQGLNITQVLQLTVDESVEIFAKQTTLKNKLDALAKVGLGYVQLGQSTSTLSGGELQRLKLASFLTTTRQKPTIFFFDEPTVGLHFDDVRRLMIIFDELILQGHTLVIIEHNTDIIRCADWLVELGPEAGDKGGKVVYNGKSLNSPI